MAAVACALSTPACASASWPDSAWICAVAASAAAWACATWVSDGRFGAADAGPASAPRVRAAVRTATRPWPNAVPTARPGTLRARTEPTSDRGPDVRIHAQVLDRQDGGERTAGRRAPHPNGSAAGGTPRLISGAWGGGIH